MTSNSAILAAVTALKAERDDLLAACKGLLRAHQTDNANDHLTAMVMAFQAVARAEGRSI